MVSASKTGIPTKPNNKEIVTATPESPSIVSAGYDVSDGNKLSAKAKGVDNTAKAPKNEAKVKIKTTENEEIVDVHQSPSKSVEESSSTGSSTWSVKMSPIKKRFSLSNKTKRSTSNVSTEAETNNDKDKHEKENDEVFQALRVSWSRIVFSAQCIF